MPERANFLVAVFNLIIKDNEILLLKRKNSGWYDGYYSVPAGHMEYNESPLEAIKRETEEEAGLKASSLDTVLVHTSYRKNETRTYVDLFFLTKSWESAPENKEPDKSEDMHFVPLNKLPENMVPETRNAIEKYLKGINYSEMRFHQKI